MRRCSSHTLIWPTITSPWKVVSHLILFLWILIIFFWISLVCIFLVANWFLGKLGVGNLTHWVYLSLVGGFRRLAISVDSSFNACIYVAIWLVVAQPETANAVENNQPLDDPPSSRFTWRIENFSRLNTKKHYSEIFIVGGFKWYVGHFLSFLCLCLFIYLSFYFYSPQRKIGGHYCLFPLCFCRRVLIFPKGNNVDHLSMYLDVADSSSLPYGWSRYAQFSLAVINQIHSKYSVRKGTLNMDHGSQNAFKKS